jgi:serine phosphatase RsbU (regulator of sigma subunit)
VDEGAATREVYLILSGEVEIAKHAPDGEIVIARREAGDVFGEMSMIEGSPRFATVRAVQETRVLELSEGAMLSAFDEQPHLLFRTTQMLSGRLRESDLQMLADLQRKNRELTQAYAELQRAQAALVERERLERELELAHQLQESILPHEFPDVPGFACAARSQPARQVGGDFYDVIPLDGQRVGLVIADVSDKGMPAALYMGLTRSLIRAESTHSDSPREILLSVHRLLMEITEATMFVTIFQGVLDPARGSFRYARAGHDRPLHLRPGSECGFLEGAGMALGAIDPVRLQEVEVEVRSGDLLVLYTDGITDAISPSGERFGVERLVEMVCAAGEASAEDLHEQIFTRVNAFQAGTEQYDDMALVVVRVEDTRAGNGHR